MSSIQSNKLNASQWLRHVEQWRTSGLTRSAYCQQHGLTVHAFGYWIKRHRTDASADSQALTLVPVKAMNQHGALLPSDLILHCPNGSKLHLPSTTPAAWLGALLKELQ